MSWPLKDSVLDPAENEAALPLQGERRPLALRQSGGRPLPDSATHQLDLASTSITHGQIGLGEPVRDPLARTPVRPRAMRPKRSQETPCLRVIDIIITRLGSKS